ncbi:hypothetical protein ACIBH1_44580 [Nonomuraea sp. NPDC050663]|uniref:hypothetical protein n=1 Tax=Nonomuraea sp. NPDC050663 TaxID=3364370 RepID=UPI003795FB87
MNSAIRPRLMPTLIAAGASCWLLASPLASAALADPGTPVSVSYTCKPPLGTGTPKPMQVTVTLPAAGQVNKALAIEWDLDTGLTTPDALAAGTVSQRGVLKLTGTSQDTVSTASATNAAIAAGQPIKLAAMKGTYTPATAGTLTVLPGEVTLVINNNGSTQETLCTPDPAAAQLAAITISATSATPSASASTSPTTSPSNSPTPTATRTVTATPSDDDAAAVITPKGAAPTGGGGLAETDLLPYAIASGLTLLAAGIGLEMRRKRVHGL